MPSASVIKLLSNPWIQINALAYGLGINSSAEKDTTNINRISD